jgi:hypothetical protein
MKVEYDRSCGAIVCKVTDQDLREMLNPRVIEKEAHFLEPLLIGKSQVPVAKFLMRRER